MSSFPYKMLSALADNWDSYGAKKIDKRCIDRACVLWGQLDGDWQVVPCSDGGVQLERHQDGLDIEIRVSPALETSAKPPSLGMHPNCTPPCPICDPSVNRREAL